MRVAEQIDLDPRTERQLRSILKREGADSRVQQRARAILLAAQGWQNKEISREILLDRRQVAVWRRRFIAEGVQALTQDVARPPQPWSLSSDEESRILEATLSGRPSSIAHWSTRTLARHLGMKAGTIERVWRRHGLRPHLQRRFQLAPESRVALDFVDAVGLFLHPAKKAIAFSCDEKGLGRKTTCKESGLPLQRGRALTMENYYKRNGRLPLFSALEALAEGPVMQPLPEEWLEFLERIDCHTRQELRLYLIEDSSSDRHPGNLQAWLLSHPRLVLHVTPTCKLWLRIFELFYRELGACRTKADVSVAIALERVVAKYVAHAHRSNNPRAFVWTSGRVSPRRISEPLSG